MHNDESLAVNPPSLPKGGGAIQSIGSGLGPVGTSGAASFQLPLPISPGRGFAPSLTLGYSSMAGNSPFGMGWSNPVSAITRRTSKGVPAYTDEDLFVGPQGDQWMPQRDTDTGALVSRNVTHYNGLAVGNYRVVRYWPRTEGAFALIERWFEGSDPVGFWLIHSADGGLHVFGKTAASRCADPGEPVHVGVWLLDESLNPLGEHIAYEYKKDDQAPDATSPRDYRAQRYLSKVYYGNVEASDQLYAWRDEGWLGVQWLFHLVFDYGERPHDLVSVPTYEEAQPWPVRSDPFSAFEYGFELSTRRLCRQVLMFHCFPELGLEPVLVQRLLLEYRETALGYNQLCAAHSQAYGDDGEARSRPPLEFTYNIFEPRVSAQQYQPFDRMPGLNDGQRYQLVDLYGEGLPGVLYRDDKAWYYREPLRADPAAHVDEVAYGDWNELQKIPLSDSAQAPRQFLSDITGDGCLEWVVAQPGLASFFTCNPDRSWSNFTTLAAFPQEFFQPLGQLADLMGAGLSDLAMIGSRSVRLYANRREDGFAPPVEVERKRDEDALPVLSNLSTELVAFSDVLGSGQQHLIRIRHDQLKCWPNLGRGRFGKGFVFSALPFGYDEFDASRVLLADLDGSGAADLVYLSADCALIYMNRCGNGFETTPIELPWPAGVRYDRFCQVSTPDLQGLGCSSLVLSVPHMSPRHWRYDFVTAKPYLLNSTNNNLGAGATVRYRSSAQEWLDEKKQCLASGQAPVCRLPFPIPLVNTQTQYDEITDNQLTQTLQYRQGYYDGRAREFRGFGLLLATDTETTAVAREQDGYTAPVLSKTWFHTGYDISPAGDDYFKGDTDAEDMGPTLFSHYHQQDAVDQIITPLPVELPGILQALAGSVLRVETYAADNPEGVPYSVEQNRYLVRKLDRPTGGSFAPYPVMLALPLESIAYHYEQQADDPVCRHAVNLSWDAFGSLTHGVTVSYARRLRALDDPACQLPVDEIAPHKRWWCDAHDSAQQAYYLNESRAQFIHLTDEQGWRLGLPYLRRDNAWGLNKGAGLDGLKPETINYEAFSLLTATNPLNPQAKRVLVGQSVQRYRDLASVSQPKLLPAGVANFQALPDYQEVAELDEKALTAYEQLRDEHGVMPFDLEQTLRDAGYHTMPWVLSPLTEEGPLWSVRRGFDAYGGLNVFYTVTGIRPTLSHGTTGVVYDQYQCIISSVTLPDGCVTQADWIDYRTLQPRRIIDPNENVQEVRYDAFGQVQASTFYGTESGNPVGFDPIVNYARPVDDDPVQAIEAPGLALGNAATAHFDDPFSWMGVVPEADRNDRTWLDECVAVGDLLPCGHVRASVRSLCNAAQALTPARQRLLALLPQVQREPVHALSLQADRYPDDPQKQIRMTLDCWDGFGRLLQSKQKVERGYAYKVDADGSLALDEKGMPVTLQDVERWRVSERVEYNNKGQPVRIYRPYFAGAYRYINDASFRQFGHCDRQYYDPLGRPTRTVLANEGYLRRHTYFPWYSVYEDENDTWEEVLAARQASGRTSMTCARIHRQTPILSVNDPRAGAVRTVRYWRENPNLPAQARVDLSVLDKASRAVAEWDPRLSVLPSAPANLTTIYSFSAKVLSLQSTDAGLRVSLFAEAGQLVQGWDGRGAQRRVEYDALLRPVALFEQARCTERYEYAPGAQPAFAEHNQCGQLIRHDDTAGTRHFNAFGLTGELLEQQQHFLRELDSPDWPLSVSARDAWLEPGLGAETTFRFNPLGDLLVQTDAMHNCQRFHQTVDGQLRDASLQLKNAVAPEVLVHHIRYNAQGRIEQQTSGNGVISRWEYCAKDGRLKRLEARRADGEFLQDLNYSYDPVGNILSIDDQALPIRFFANQRIEPINRYVYDSLYQLIEAHGWEAGSANRGPDHLEDPKAVANYRQTYRYDAGGNLRELIHQGPQQHGHRLTAATYSNRCLPDQDGRPPTEAEIAASFDENGNLLALEKGRTLSWDVRNQLQQVSPVERESAVNDTERYVYGADGMRVRKVRSALTNARTVVSETRYLPGLEIRQVDGDILHVITAEAGRTTVQVLHWETPPPSHVGNDQYRYNLGDHLGSCSLELDSEAQVVSRETYHPFGTTAFSEHGDSSEESYRTLRYSGKERDATGLYYYGFRYYSPWLQRWINPDPAGAIDGLNLYRMVRNNPVSLWDEYGLSPPEDDMNKSAKSSKSLFQKIVSPWRKKNDSPSAALPDLSIGRKPETYLLVPAGGGDPTLSVVVSREVFEGGTTRIKYVGANPDGSANEDSNTRGYIDYLETKGPEETALDIHLFDAKPEGKGFGSLLLLELAYDAEEKSINRIAASSVARSAAGFYLGAGFHPGKEGRDALEKMIPGPIDFGVAASVDGAIGRINVDQRADDTNPMEDFAAKLHMARNASANWDGETALIKELAKLATIKRGYFKQI